MAFLIDDIFLLPVKGVVWIGEKIKESAEAELYDESRVQEALGNLQMRLELGEITEDAYRKEEALLLKRMEEIKNYKEEKGG
ncbi:MAG: gas vesicle protein GvpG [Deltaproteobacteria bacterium]|nr:gas vesicle protein GvpG [Deltaproteobacteria bacterium]